MIREEAIKFIQDFHKPHEHICLVLWCVEDVLERAKELGIKVSKAEAEEIIDRMEHHHDASIGISWDTIDVYVYQLRDEQKERAENEAKAKAREKVNFT